MAIWYGQRPVPSSPTGSDSAASIDAPGASEGWISPRALCSPKTRTAATDWAASSPTLLTLTCAESAPSRGSTTGAIEMLMLPAAAGLARQSASAGAPTRMSCDRRLMARRRLAQLPAAGKSRPRQWQTRRGPPRVPLPDPASEPRPPPEAARPARPAPRPDGTPGGGSAEGARDGDPGPDGEPIAPGDGATVGRTGEAAPGREAERSARRPAEARRRAPIPPASHASPCPTMPSPQGPATHWLVSKVQLALQ